MRNFIPALLLTGALISSSHLPAGAQSVSATQAAGKSFTLDGLVIGAPRDSVFIHYQDAAGEFISIRQAIINGKFSISGRLEGPTHATIAFNAQSSKYPETLYLEPGHLQLKVDPDHIKSLSLSGSQTQLDKLAYDSLVAPINQRFSSLNKELKATTDPDKKATLVNQQNALQQEETNIAYRFFLSHPHSYLTEEMLQFYGMFMGDDTTKQLYNDLSPELKNNRIGRVMGEKITAKDAVSPGHQAAGFTATDVNGQPISLTSFKGHYVILDFWASWCGPCRKSHPQLRAMYAKYKDKGLEIIGIADDLSRPDAWKQAIAKDSIGGWHHILGGSDSQKIMKGEKNPDDIMARYGISGLPTKFLIDPNGKILQKEVGTDLTGMDQELAKRLN